MVRTGNIQESEEGAPLLATREMPYPKSVFFIIVTEFCERFSYTGMRTILTMYIRNVLYRSYSNAGDIATVIYHAFVSLCFFTPLIGGIIADSFLGKFKTILYISILYAIGNCILSITAITPFHLPKIPFSLLGLALIAIGTGGIKPCVNAFAADQFQLPEQTMQLHQFFFYFYFAINSGSLLSNFVTPIMRKDVSCFGYDTCYSLAFGTPALFWIVALVIFVSGSRLYKIKNPEGNVAVQVIGCIWYALFHKSDVKEGHWLDKSKDKYCASFVEDVKVLFRILLLFIPLPIYWALYEQQGSTWTLQASRMKGYISSYVSLKPDQMQAINSFLILFYIPLFERIIYPLLKKCNILTTSLQRMSVGCVMLAVAFMVAGFVELSIEPTYAKLPGLGKTNLHFINSIPCPIHISMRNSKIHGSTPYTRVIQPYENYTFVSIPAQPYNISSELFNMDDNCTIPVISTFTSFEAESNKAYSTLIRANSIEDDKIRLKFSEDDLEKSREGNAKFRVMYSLSEPNLKMQLVNSNNPKSTPIVVYLNDTTDSTPMMEIDPEMYTISIFEDSREKHRESFLLDEGGNYILALFPEETGSVVDLDFSIPLKKIVLTSPNSVHMLYLFPQYVILTLAELFFSITGFTFSYTQAPASMKAVIQAIWLLTIGLGSFLVIVITSMDMFEKPAMHFFSYSGIMLFGTVLFVVLAYNYTPSDVQPLPKTEDTCDNSQTPDFVLDSEEITALAVELGK